MLRHAGCPGTATFPSWKNGFRVIFEMQQKTHTSFRALTLVFFHLGQGLKFFAAFKESFGFPLPTCQAFLNKAASRFVEQILEILQIF